MSIVSDRVLSEFSDKEFRDAYVEARARNYIAYQIKAVREQRGLSQADLADLQGKKQSEISRFEDPEYGRLTTTTLLKIAAALDVTLLIRLCSHEEFLFQTAEMSPEHLHVPPYSDARVRAKISNYSSIPPASGASMPILPAHSFPPRGPVIKEDASKTDFLRV